MIYLFRCPAHGTFEIEQPMMQTHEALCPVCEGPTQRIYTPLEHFWTNSIFHKDGSHQSPDELPPVSSGPGKYFHGF